MKNLKLKIYLDVFINYFLKILDWKLEQNPVSGFLSLLRNVLHRHSNNIDQLMQGSNIAIIGILMQKVISIPILTFL